MRACSSRLSDQDGNRQYLCDGFIEMSSNSSTLSAEAQANLPRHVAVIMDGNGRWAKARHLPRIEGHRRGADSAREIIRARKCISARPKAA